MHKIEKDGLVWYTFEQSGPGLRHAVFTRHGGASTGYLSALNLGSTVGDDPEAVSENHRRVRSVFNLTPERVVSPYQVHSNHVAQVTMADGGHFVPGTDALMTGVPGVALLLRFADCTPVLFYDPVHHSAALAHSGWRGTAAGVVPATVKAMERAFGSSPGDLWAGIGPAIGPEHYAVGPEVVAAIEKAVPPGSPVATLRGQQWYLDMPGAIYAQLASLGVGTIESSGFCTASRTDLWYSHRGEQGKTGRFGVLVLLD